LACLATLSAQLLLWSHVSDDAYISFRYVDRLVDGAGLTFNPGERVEGFSNPLWVLCLALGRLVTRLGCVDVARLLGLGAALGTLGLMWRIVRLVHPEMRTPAFFLASTLVIVSPGFHVYATAGLEGPLLGLLLLAGIHASLGPTARARTLAALFFGLAAVARPEAPLYGALWWLFTRGPRRLLEAPKAELPAMAALAGPALAYQIFRLVYFDAWLPNTFTAKPAGTFGDLFGVPYVLPWLAAVGGPALALLWLLVPFRTTSALAELRRTCIGPLIGVAVFVVYAQGDWMPFGRFIVPAFPLLAVALGVWLADAIAHLVHAAHEHVAEATVQRVVFGVGCALVVSSVLAWKSPVMEYLEDRRLTTVMRGHDQLAVGRWLARHVEKGTTVATGRLGGISYGAPDLIFWDANGLTDREQAQFIRRGGPTGRPQDTPVLQRGPHIVAPVDVPAAWGYRRNATYMEWLDRHYVQVGGFPQGNYGTMDIWLAKDQLQRLRDWQPAAGTTEITSYRITD
jgi:hypothetical protein